MCCVCMHEDAGFWLVDPIAHCATGSPVVHVCCQVRVHTRSLRLGTLGGEPPVHGALREWLLLPMEQHVIHTGTVDCDVVHGMV